VDKMLVPLLDTLNSIPGCRTLYSCDGHGKESFYITMGICSEQVFEKVAKIFKENTPEFEIDDGIGPDGLLDYERHLGIYSWGVGSSPYWKRRRFIEKMTKIFKGLVPYNLW
jgi:hypothetical protein